MDDRELIRQVRRLTVEADRFTHLFGDLHDLHRTDLTALVVIMDAAVRGHPVSQGELAESLNLSPSATTSVLDRLQHAGHLERRRDTGDRRRVVLHVRDSALELGRDLFTPLGEAYAAAWREFDSAQRDTILRFLSATIEATVRTRTELLERDGS
ncbi:MarR family winged helix-turn-helix transcriptional regulator [Saccharomonospora piscinae]|uniref:MarR family transcriptional regulator n=1 Tax=Saccharomonospora piscinae TaxID=687388 RepID=A0A1V9A7A6_SACPI|nr:MarR family transcriptional regulator [Saccharomonospora piscinae]OQO93002.1 MarR family transcriptional regulator [Saccharomonospora piscinae]TLW93140.1 MarR family transcriptional regulator [Saccharomonospora piscinae]